MTQNRGQLEYNTLLGTGHRCGSPPGAGRARWRTGSGSHAPASWNLGRWSGHTCVPTLERGNEPQSWV